MCLGVTFDLDRNYLLFTQKNQNSKTVNKTIIDGGHLWKIIDQK
jgi:hypothetical protein